MKRITIALLAATAMILTGCMSDKQWADTKEMHKNYMNQPRTYGAVTAKFAPAGGTVTLTGVTELTLEAPLNPLTVIPQAPEVVKDVVDGIVRAGTVAGATYVGHDLATRSVGSTSYSTVNNNAAPAATP